MAITTIPRHRATRKPLRLLPWPWKPKPNPPAPPPPEEPWHKAYGSQFDEHGTEVPDYTRWRRCTCEIGANHLAD